MDSIQDMIENGGTYLGIEFGSTRIKAVLIDGGHFPIASASFEWENRLENGIWTYRLEDALTGMASAFAMLKKRCGALVQHRADHARRAWHFGHDARLYPL